MAKLMHLNAWYPLSLWILKDVLTPPLSYTDQYIQNCGKLTDTPVMEMKEIFIAKTYIKRITFQNGCPNSTL